MIHLYLIFLVMIFLLTYECGRFLVCKLFTLKFAVVRIANQTELNRKDLIAEMV